MQKKVIILIGTFIILITILVSWFWHRSESSKINNFLVLTEKEKIKSLTTSKENQYVNQEIVNDLTAPTNERKLEDTSKIIQSLTPAKQ